MPKLLKLYIGREGEGGQIYHNITKGCEVGRCFGPLYLCFVIYVLFLHEYLLWFYTLYVELLQEFDLCLCLVVFLAVLFLSLITIQV